MPEVITPQIIRETREALRRSQTEFAKLLGTTQVTISRWENTKTPTVPLYVFQVKLAKLIDYVRRGNNDNSYAPDGEE